MTNRAALAALLALPDEPSLRGRGHRWTQPGKANRAIWKIHFALKYIGHHQAERLERDDVMVWRK